MAKFAFIIHPLTLSDYFRKFPWMKVLPEFVLNKIARYVPPFKVSRITGIKSAGGGEIEGFFVCCPLTSQQMMQLPEELVLRKIISTGKRAEKLGVDIIGLGSFTSVVGDKGVTVARQLETPVTTGNSYTVATAIEGTKLAAEKMNLDLSEVTVVGATGSIGRAVTLILAQKGRHLHLVSRNEKKLKKLAEEAGQCSGTKITYTTEIKKAVGHFPVIISASGSVETLIDPGDLLPGSVVCDVARPRDVADKVGSQRKDVLVIDGGVVKIPGDVNFNFDFGYPPGTAYACMAETMLLTLEKKFVDYSLGSTLKLSRVRETAQLATRHGFKLAGLRSFDKPLPEKEINRIRRNAKKKLGCKIPSYS